MCTSAVPCRVCGAANLQVGLVWGHLGGLDRTEEWMLGQHLLLAWSVRIQLLSGAQSLTLWKSVYTSGRNLSWVRDSDGLSTWQLFLGVCVSVRNPG